MPDRFMYVKRGYDPQEVDRYIESLEAVIKSYKEKDSAIKNAIISAQMAADNIVKNATIQVSDAKNQTLNQVKSISVSIAAQRAKILEFQQDYNAIIKKYVQNFNDGDIQVLMEKIDSLENYVSKLGYQASEIGVPVEGDTTDVSDEVETIQRLLRR